jgi:hypothetical protein
MKPLPRRRVSSTKGAFHRKERAMLKLIYAGALASTALISLSFAATTPVSAPDEAQLTSGHVLACDTAEEIEAVLNSTGDNISTRVVAINDRFGKESCNIVTAIFYRGDQAKTVLVPDGIVRIVKVNMIGYRDGEAWMRMSRPVAQYVGVLEKATSV